MSAVFNHVNTLTPDEYDSAMKWYNSMPTPKKLKNWIVDVYIFTLEYHILCLADALTERYTKFGFSNFLNLDKNKELRQFFYHTSRGGVISMARTMRDNDISLLIGNLYNSQDIRIHLRNYARLSIEKRLAIITKQFEHLSLNIVKTRIVIDQSGNFRLETDNSNIRLHNKTNLIIAIVNNTNIYCTLTSPNSECTDQNIPRHLFITGINYDANTTKTIADAFQTRSLCNNTHDQSARFVTENLKVAKIMIVIDDDNLHDSTTLDVDDVDTPFKRSVYPVLLYINQEIIDANGAKRQESDQQELVVIENIPQYVHKTNENDDDDLDNSSPQPAPKSDQQELVVIENIPQYVHKTNENDDDDLDNSSSKRRRYPIQDNVTSDSEYGAEAKKKKNL